MIRYYGVQTGRRVATIIPAGAIFPKRRAGAHQGAVALTHLEYFRIVNGGSMRRTVRRWGLGVAPVVGLLAWATMPITGQSGAKNGEWTTYGADLRNTRYSPLDQITAAVTA